jgi:putative addiction module antidote
MHRKEDLMVQLTVRKVGNSLGVILPLEAARTLQVKEGDKLFLTEAPGGSFRISPYDPNFAQTMNVAEDFMGRFKNALRDLGK